LSPALVSSNNLLKPATGDPVAVPNQDIVWGGYYLTYIEPESKVKKIFADEDEAERAFALGVIGLQDLIKVRVFRAKHKILETSVGRVLFNRILPEEMDFVNKTLDLKLEKASQTRKTTSSFHKLWENKVIFKFNYC